MNVHVIIDFQYNYYKHKYSIESGKVNKLSAVVDGEDLDTTYIYHTLADIESHRNDFTKKNKDGSYNNVTVSICLDRKSARKEESGDYKSNRSSNRLGQDDFDNINRIIEALRIAGYNIYSEEGKEADDLIKSLTDEYKESFDITCIYTNDSDILVNLDEEHNVRIMRYKSSNRAHTMYSQMNMPALMSKEFKCDIRDNTIILYKSLVGDKSDVIKGVKGFGIKAFDKYIDFLENEMMFTDEDFSKLRHWEKVEAVLTRSIGYLGEDTVDEALESLNLVKCQPVTVTKQKPVKMDTRETRELAYSPYQMNSLIK